MTPYEECWDALHSYLHKIRRKHINEDSPIARRVVPIHRILKEMNDIENEIIGEMEDE